MTTSMTRRLGGALLALMLGAGDAPAQTYGFLFQFGSQGSDDGEFNSLRGVAVASSGNIVVADTANHRNRAFPCVVA